MIASQTSPRMASFVAAAGLRFALAEPNERSDVPFARDFGAGLLAHERGERRDSSPSLCLRKRRDKACAATHEAEHAVAEKLEPLIGIALALGRRGADMGQRARRAGRGLETMANPRLESWQ